MGACLRFRWRIALLFLLPAAWGVGGTAPAQPPVLVDSYRLLPRLSVLHRTGGIAGVHDRYRLSGGFDLAREATPWVGAASFENAEVWGSQISPFPVIAIVEDVDQWLNLEGLEGHALPVGAPLDVYGFRGQTAEGAPIQLFAALVGPWMVLRGGTLPDPGGADFFEYDLRAIARRDDWGDANEDGVVNAADYVVARDSGDPLKLDLWRSQFGQSMPSFALAEGVLEGKLASARGAAAGVTQTPEPAGVLLCASLACMGPRRRR